MRTFEIHLVYVDRGNHLVSKLGGTASTDDPNKTVQAIVDDFAKQAIHDHSNLRQHGPLRWEFTARQIG